jgi:hypothetical protein
VPLVIGTVLGVMVIGNWTSAGCSRPSSRLSRSPSSLPG